MGEVAPFGYPISLAGIAALVSALFAALILIVYLKRRPALDLRWKLLLALGLGVLPGLSSISGTAAGMQRTTERQFCGSCHVMDAHVSDSNDPKSQSLAARHARNRLFGDENCYVCHADYGMFGYPVTKLNGMRHVYEYYLGGYSAMTLDHAVSVIRLVKPYDNTNCRQCHSGTLAQWSSVPDHVSLTRELEQNQVSCASAGCHGFAHPFSKTPEERAVKKPLVEAKTGDGTTAGEALQSKEDAGAAVNGDVTSTARDNAGTAKNTKSVAADGGVQPKPANPRGGATPNTAPQPSPAKGPTP